MRDFFAENTIDWKVVEKFEKEGTISGYCMALAECDKLLNFLLERESYGGMRTSDRVKQAQTRFANLSELFKAIEIKANVFEKYEESVSIQDLKDAIRTYRDSINDFVQGQIKEQTIWEKFTAFIQYNLFNRPGFLTNFLVSFLLFVILVLVLDSTHFGQELIHALANFFKSILPVVVIAIIIFGVLLILMIVILFYSTRKNFIKKQLQKIRNEFRKK